MYIDIQDPYFVAVAFSVSGTKPTKYNVGFGAIGDCTLHLSRIRPLLVEKNSLFRASIRGQQIAEGDFKFESQDKLVSIENTVGISIAITGHVSNSFAIPIEETDSDPFAFSDFNTETVIVD